MMKIKKITKNKWILKIKKINQIQKVNKTMNNNGCKKMMIMKSNFIMYKIMNNRITN